MNSTVIAISGKQGSGKTTLANGLTKWCRDRGKIAAHLKFADPLYEMHDAVLKVLASYGHQGAPKKDGKLLQLLGTEWGRATLGKDIWVDLARNKIKDRRSFCRLVVVDDMRFPNEFELFEKLRLEGAHVVTVRLDAEEAVRRFRAESWRDATDHPSETGLDGYSANSFDCQLYTGEIDADFTLQVVLKAAGLT